MFNHFLAAQGSVLPFSLENMVQLRMSINYLHQTCLDSATHEQTIICRQLFVGCWLMEGKKKLHRMIIFVVVNFFIAAYFEFSIY